MNYSPKTFIPSEKPQTIPTYIQNNPLQYSLAIYDTFDNWYSHYTYIKKTGLEDLTFANIVKIYDVVTKIEEKIQLSPEPKISIFLNYSIDLTKIKYPIETMNELEKSRLEALDYLEQNGVIAHCEHIIRQIYGNIDEPSQLVEITIDISQFKEFLPKITVAYEKAIQKKETIKPSPQPVNNKSQIHLELPPDTKWKDIAIRFKDGHNVDIKIGDKTTPSDYKAMGFEDKRTRKPDKQWELLIKLSERNGEIDWQSRPQSKNFNRKLTEQKFGFESDADDESQNRGFSYKKAPDSTKKAKQLLAKELKAFFKIKEDPFLPYRKEGSYKIKINLIPA